MRYEIIIRDFLESKNVKLKGYENDGRMLVEHEGTEFIFHRIILDDEIRIYNNLVKFYEVLKLK